MSKREKQLIINAAVSKAIVHDNREIASEEQKIHLQAEENNQIDCIVDSPHIGKTCDIHLSKDRIQIFMKDEDKLVYDHCIDHCIKIVGTRIPNRDTVFVYCVELAHNFDNANEMKIPSSTSRQIFVFDFDDLVLNYEAHNAVIQYFKTPPMNIPPTTVFRSYSPK